MGKTLEPALLSSVLFFVLLLLFSASMASADPERHDEVAETTAEDEDTGAQVAPIVRLEEVAVTTGEEDEDALLDL